MRVSMRVRRFAVLCALVTIGVSASSVAEAGAGDAKRAEELYDRALALATAGKHAEACPLFAQSQELDPALGTEFNLADCYEKIGQTASALRLFGDVAGAARAAGKDKLEGRAKERAKALEARVPRVKLVYEEPGGATVDVSVDGKRVDAGVAAGDGVPVDPGAHRVEVAAAGKQPWQSKFTAEGGKVVALPVPKLTAVAVPVAIAAAPESGHPDPAMRITGASLAGAGVIAGVIGAVFVATALSRRAAAREACGDPDPDHCHNRDALPLWADAQTAGNVATGTLIASAVLIAAGAVLWFSAPTVTTKGATSPRTFVAATPAGIMGTF